MNNKKRINRKRRRPIKQKKKVKNVFPKKKVCNQLPKNKKYMGLDAFPKREYASSNYIQDKYSQYRISIDNYWPPQITDLPFYNDVYYSQANSLGCPIYMNPSYDTLQNASFCDVIEPRHYVLNNDINQYQMPNRYTPMPGLQFESNNEAFNMERDSYNNTLNSQNKDVNYKEFIEDSDSEEEIIERPVKIVDRNKDYINILIIILLTTILIINY